MPFVILHLWKKSVLPNLQQTLLVTIFGFLTLGFHYACQHIPLRFANPTFKDLYCVPYVFENEPERRAVKPTEHWHGLDPSGVERHVGYALDKGTLRAHLP